MKRFLQNPYALYVFCDGGMDYDSKNTGGIGIEIIFPEFTGLETITKPIGKYEGANIERIELEAIISSLEEVLALYKVKQKELKNVNKVIIKTDRFALNAQLRTNPYRIREWRKNDWKNHEGKAIKNSDLLEKIDKLRKKLSSTHFCTVDIEYGRSKFNKTAHNLAKIAKLEPIVRRDISIKGSKIGKRKYDDLEIEYSLLIEGEKYLLHIYKKEPVNDQWEISAEFIDGKFIGKKIKIYTDSKLEKKLHRHHEYFITLKKVNMYHVLIEEEITENYSEKNNAKE